MYGWLYSASVLYNIVTRIVIICTVWLSGTLVVATVSRNRYLAHTGYPYSTGIVVVANVHQPAVVFDDRLLDGYLESVDIDTCTRYP